MICLQASRCSTLMIRLAGAVREANSSIFPTSDHPISVVFVRSGCRANRMSGTESAAPITTVPKPSSTPRNDRRDTDSSDATFSPVPIRCSDPLIFANEIGKKRSLTQVLIQARDKAGGRIFAFVVVAALARSDDNNDPEVNEPNDSKNGKTFLPSGAIFFFALLILFYAALWLVIYWIMIARA